MSSFKWSIIVAVWSLQISGPRPFRVYHETRADADPKSIALAVVRPDSNVVRIRELNGLIERTADGSPKEPSVEMKRARPFCIQGLLLPLPVPTLRTLRLRLATRWATSSRLGATPHQGCKALHRLCRW